MSILQNCIVRPMIRYINKISKNQQIKTCILFQTSAKMCPYKLQSPVDSQFVDMVNATCYNPYNGAYDT